jgi:hypothetical protein
VGSEEEGARSPRSELQIEEHMDAQRIGWVVDRIGWITMLVVILTAVGGLFGNGLFGTRTITTRAGAMRVTYDRFGRYGADSKLSFQLSLEALDRGEWRLSIGRAYLEDMAIDDIVPEPDSVEAKSEALVYIFVAEESSDLLVTFDLTGNSVGSVHGSAQLDNSRESASFDQFFFP